MYNSSSEVKRATVEVDLAALGLSDGSVEAEELLSEERPRVSISRRSGVVSLSVEGEQVRVVRVSGR